MFNRFLFSLSLCLYPTFRFAFHTTPIIPYRIIMISIWFIIYKRNNHCHNYFILECVVQTYLSVICLWFDSNCGERHELISARYANTIIMFHMIFVFDYIVLDEPTISNSCHTGLKNQKRKKIKTTTTTNEKNFFSFKWYLGGITK